MPTKEDYKMRCLKVFKRSKDGSHIITKWSKMGVKDYYRIISLRDYHSSEGFNSFRVLSCRGGFEVAIWDLSSLFVVDVYERFVDAGLFIFLCI